MILQFPQRGESRRGALNPRVMAGVVVLLALVVGGFTGATVERIAHRRPTLRGAPTDAQRAEMRKRGLDRMTQDLSLDSVQRAHVESAMMHHDSAMQALVVETSPRFRALADSLDASIEQVLSSEQKSKFRDERSKQPRGAWTR